jgi:tetratricopeptide (TPR) repeat protein
MPDARPKRWTRHGVRIGSTPTSRSRLDPGARARAPAAPRRDRGAAAGAAARAAARPRERSLLASALLRCGRHRDAIPAFLDALALKLDDAPMHHQLGLCFRELGMQRQAIECFRTVLALGPSPVEHRARALLAFDARALCARHDADAQLQPLRDAAAGLPAGAVQRSEPFV